jgi:hypothetical protein
VGAVAAALVVGLLGLDAAGLGVRSDAWGARAPTTARRILGSHGDLYDRHIHVL